jgi:hypothetical protein
MASQLRRTDDLQRLKVRELVLQGSTGSYAPATSLLTMDSTGRVIAGVTGTIQNLTATSGVAAPTIYTTTIRPYPPGSTGACNITGRFTLNNADTNDGADVTLIQMIQTDGDGECGAVMYVVGEDSVGFGGDPNDQNEFCTYAYPKPARAPITKVESTPLMAGTIGPAGLTGGFGDKYFYGNIQVKGYMRSGGDIVSGAGLRIAVPTVPTAANSTGSPGQIAWGNAGGTDYIYVCVATNTWKRTALSTWT